MHILSTHMLDYSNIFSFKCFLWPPHRTRLQADSLLLELLKQFWHEASEHVARLQVSLAEVGFRWVAMLIWSSTTRFEFSEAACTHECLYQEQSLAGLKGVTGLKLCFVAEVVPLCWLQQSGKEVTSSFWNKPGNCFLFCIPLSFAAPAQTSVWTLLSVSGHIPESVTNKDLGTNSCLLSRS